MAVLAGAAASATSPRRASNDSNDSAGRPGHTAARERHCPRRRVCNGRLVQMTPPPLQRGAAHSHCLLIVTAHKSLDTMYVLAPPECAPRARVRVTLPSLCAPNF